MQIRVLKEPQNDSKISKKSKNFKIFDVLILFFFRNFDVFGDFAQNYEIIG